MLFVTKRKIFYALSIFLVLFSVCALFFWGLHFSIEFTGGALIEVSYPGPRPELGQIEAGLKTLPLGETLVQPTGTDGYIVRTKDLNQEERQGLLKVLSLNGKSPLEEKRYNLVGPSIGTELQRKAWVAIVLVMLAISLFLAYAFRKASGTVLTAMDTPIRSWHYGLITILTLVHDVIIPVGIFSFLGTRFVDAQIDVLFVVALLTILGYSVHDTIVVFDRVRENLRKNQELRLKKNFEDIVSESLSQTLVRSLNTSLTTFLATVALFFFGSIATKNFALMLGIGVVVGTYSSLCIAAPLIVTLDKLLKKRT